MYKIVTSPLGLIFKLIRENASRAEAIGYNVRYYKLISFSIASTFTGLAGSLYVLIHSMVRIDEIHSVIYVIKPFFWLTYFTTKFETAGEIFEISGQNGH